MNISIEQLELAFASILAQMKADGKTTFEIDEDFYWDINSLPARYDPYNKPDEIGLGQLTQDWEEIEWILKNETVPHAFLLVRLSSILRRIGEKL